MDNDCYRNTGIIRCKSPINVKCFSIYTYISFWNNVIYILREVV